MRALLVLVAVPGLAVAGRKGSVTETYRAARAECAKPGLAMADATAEYNATWLSGWSLGARVVTDWHTLTDAQRKKFGDLADKKILAAERARLVAALCNPRDKYTGESETSDVSNNRYGKVWLRHHVAGDEFQVAWVFRYDVRRWVLVSSEAPSFDYPGIDKDPVPATIRHHLAGDYAHAMAALAAL